jgi:hypothetical protein
MQGARCRVQGVRERFKDGIEVVGQEALPVVAV